MNIKWNYQMTLVSYTSNIYKYIKNINMDSIIYILFIYKYIKKNK